MEGSSGQESSAFPQVHRKMMILTRAQHTWHTYCHVSSHQGQEQDHFPLCIRAFHLSQRVEKHCIYPEEQGKELGIYQHNYNAYDIYKNCIEVSASPIMVGNSPLGQCWLYRSSSMDIV
jgi:hypothetical protein